MPDRVSRPVYTAVPRMPHQGFRFAFKQDQEVGRMHLLLRTQTWEPGHQLSAPSLTGCVTLSELLHPSLRKSFYLQNETIAIMDGHTSPHLTGWL